MVRVSDWRAFRYKETIVASRLGRGGVKASNKLLSQLQRFLDRQGIAAGGMVVAVSGGPDSVALLHALVQLRAARTDVQGCAWTGPLVLAHFNHQLRAAESDADEAFVRQLHARLAQRVDGLLLRCASADVR